MIGSSSTRIGSTTDSCPLPSALAWSRKPAKTGRIPPNHTGWCARLQISFGLRFCRRGACWPAFRCSTEDVALAHAASTASR